MTSNYYNTKELNYIIKTLAPELGITFTGKITDEMEAITECYQHGELIAKNSCSSVGLQAYGIEMIYNILKLKEESDGLQ